MDSFTVKKRTKSFTEGIINKTEKTYVCMLDNIIAGFVTLAKCRDTDIDNAGEIWGIYLDPSFWRKGIGTVLANWAVDYLTKSGYKKIVLWVFKDNTPSRKFYASLGFISDEKEMLVEACNAKGIRYIKDIS
jgi:RimJ/RimL family protein N-acetyltransferase